MKKIVAGIFFFIILACWAFPAAAEISLTLRLDRREATLVDTIQMEVGVSGSRNSDARPVVQGLEAFLVSQGGTSSRVEIINGKINAGLTYTFFIQPQKIGTFEIGPAEIKANGKILKSNSAKLVVKASDKKSGSDRSPVFIEASLTSPRAYIEEQVIYTLKLYRRVHVDNLSLSLPQVEQLVFKQLGEPREYQSTLDGTPYQVLEIRYSLSASKDGEYVIGPSKMNMNVRRRRSQSLFDDFFRDPFSQSPFPSFSTGRPLTVATSQMELTVLSLPEEKKPADYSGLVGNFRMESRLHPNRLKTGESATLTIEISGKGNIHRIPDIELPDLPFARAYGDQPLLESEPGEDGIGGRKTMKWALVPQKEGRYELPVLKLSYFNPDTKTYDVLHTANHTLSVAPGQTPASADIPTSAPIDGTAGTAVKKGIEQIGQDILPIHMTADNLSVPFQKLSSGWLFWLAFIGPLSTYLMLLVGIKLGKHSPDRMAQSKSKNAFRKLSKRCRQDTVGCAVLIDAFRDYLNDRYNLSIGALTPDDVEDVLRSKGIAADHIKNIYALVERLENAVYARDNAQPKDAPSELLRLVKSLEKES
jgi:hypothetical protein